MLELMGANAALRVVPAIENGDGIMHGPCVLAPRTYWRHPQRFPFVLKAEAGLGVSL